VPTFRTVPSVATACMSTPSATSDAEPIGSIAKKTHLLSPDQPSSMIGRGEPFFAFGDQAGYERTVFPSIRIDCRPCAIRTATLRWPEPRPAPACTRQLRLP
jgi:hypothetical protein